MYPFKYHDPEKAGLRHLLVELVMQRQAKRQGILLHKGFWSDPIWKIEYAQQLAAATILINTFKEENYQEIIDAITELEWLTSLRAKQLKEKIYQRIANRDAKQKRDQELIAPKAEIVIETKEVSGVRRKSQLKKGDL